MSRSSRSLLASLRPFSVLPALALLACSGALPGEGGDGDEGARPAASRGALASSSLLPTTGACPTFHCAAEATGAMGLPLEATAYPVRWNPKSLGSLTGQGCGGDGRILACLFSSDGSGSGTLKVLDPARSAEVWGSAKPGSFPLSGRAASGQVPLITADGAVLASDDVNLVRFDAATGAATRVALPAGSAGSSSFGVVPLTGTRAFVTQSNGIVVPFDAATMKLDVNVATPLTSPSGAALRVVSPATAHENRAYLVTKEAGAGLVPGYLSTLEMTGGAPVLKWSYPFKGASGASAVVVTPAISGRAHPVVIFHVPARSADARKNDTLVAVEDLGESAQLLWEQDLGAPMDVAPLLDPIKKVLLLHLRRQPTVQVRGLATGALSFEIDVRKLAPLGDRSGDLVLNGHMVGTFAGGARTVLLSASGAAGQVVFGIDPGDPRAATPVPASLRWSVPTGAAAEGYTAAWTIQVRPTGGNCPVFVGSDSGVNVLCPN